MCDGAGERVRQCTCTCLHVHECAWGCVHALGNAILGSRGRADARSSIPGPQLAMHCMALTTGLRCHQERKGLAHVFPNTPGGNGISWSPRMRAKMGTPAQCLGCQGRKVPDTGQRLDEVPTVGWDGMGTLNEGG